MKVKICIMPKADVLDPQGQAVQKSLSRLDFEDLVDVKVGKFLEITFSKDHSEESVAQEVKNMCEKLLVNCVIEDYTFEITSH